MSATALVGGAIQVVGAGLGFAAKQKMIADQTDISKKSENVRKQQMLLDATRRKRAAIREGLIMRSMALTNGTTQGAALGSGVQAGKGAGASRSGEGQQSTNAASILGGRMFNLNQKYFEVSQGGQLWGGIGEGLGAIGGTVVNNAGSINALMGKPPATTGGGW